VIDGRKGYLTHCGCSILHFIPVNRMSDASCGGR
jgi:hypothetical protein